MSNTFYTTAISYFRNKYPGAASLSNTLTISDANTKQNLFTVQLAIMYDFRNGNKQKVLIIQDLNLNKINQIINHLENQFNKLGASSIASISHPETLDEISTKQMSFSSKLFVYTNKLHCNKQDALNKFKEYKILVEIIDESNLYKTVFISYGGPDEAEVKKINDAIKLHGVKTWFFPDDSKPGDKLHRMMTNGVNNHDYILLICSINSLNRAGVLNEIERVFERESQEGGSNILIPITLDDYIFQDWQPSKPDIAQQIKSRVIHKVDSNHPSFNSIITKIINVLRQKQFPI